MPIIPFGNDPDKPFYKPFAAHWEILKYSLALQENVETRKTLPIDLCCGLGYGKTALCIQLAALTLDYDGNQRGLFLEPDWDRVKDVFIPMWTDIVPESMYTWELGKNKIIWKSTGSILNYRPRVISGSKARNRGKQRGPEYSFIIDDETAIGFDMETYQNNFARIRRPSPINYYFTASTPLIGPYGNYLKTPGHKLFKGKTSDNPYLPKNYESGLRALMSTDQARRELDAELVALEGRIWKEVDLETEWPHGNIHHQHTCFDPDKPWWLFCDFGKATGSYVVIQQSDPLYRNRLLYNGLPVWVAVADLCPKSDASAARAFGILKENYGTPVGVVGGRDINTGASTDAKTIAYFAFQAWGNVKIYPTDESIFNKQLQFDRLSYLICSAMGERRFTVAKDFKSIDPDSKRGVIELFNEDVWLNDEDRRQQDFLPKNKQILVQHTRDALLMGAVKIMSPPKWNYNEDIAK